MIGIGFFFIIYNNILKVKEKVKTKIEKRNSNGRLLKMN
jgi:hypothetical protein